MLDFKPLRLARFEFQLQELTLNQVRSLYNIHPDFLEKQRTFFIKSAIKDIRWNKGLEHLTIDDLTVQERLLIEGSYLSAISDDMNFELGEGHYYDYMKFEKQYKLNNAELGLLTGDTEEHDKWFIRNITGLQAEIVEERVLAKDKPERTDWILYSMAVQMYRTKDIDGSLNTEKEPDIKENPLAYGDYLDRKVERLSSLPESVAIELVDMFFIGLNKLHHFFQYSFDDNGIFVLNEKTDEVAVCGARFCPRTLIHSDTLKIFGKH